MSEDLGYLKDLDLNELRAMLSSTESLPSISELTDIFDRLDQDQLTELCQDSTNPIFEIFTEEYIDALANYVLSRLQEYGAIIDNPLVILELAAGNGRLTHFLRQKLQTKSPGLAHLIASDSHSLKIQPLFPVLIATQLEALEIYRPHIIITSWMPQNKDFSADIRATSSVLEYILIGEIDSNCCGDRWSTWGNLDPSATVQEPLIAPYRADGFQRVEIQNLTDMQFSRTRDGISHTVSFQREEPTVIPQSMEDIVMREIEFYKKMSPDKDDEKILSLFFNNFYFKFPCSKAGDRHEYLNNRLNFDEEYIQRFHEKRRKTPLENARSSDNPKLSVQTTRLRYSDHFNNKTHEEFAKDLLDAIAEAGVDIEEIKRYMDLKFDTCKFNYQTEKRLLLPVFIKMREKGYSHGELA